MQKVRIDICCDICWQNDEAESAAEFHETVSLGSVAYELDWCKTCNEAPRNLDEMVELFMTLGRKLPHSGHTPGRRTKPFRQASSGIRTNASGEYKCPRPECDYSTSREQFMEGHLNWHDGVLPFACDYPGCNAKYSLAQSLGTHKMHHAKKDGTYVPNIKNRVRTERREQQRKELGLVTS